MKMEENKNTNQENNEGAEIYTLVDEEGNETEFEVLASTDYNGKTYYAMIPVQKDAKKEEKGEFEEYVILRVDTDENGENMLVTIDDDDEFDNVADIFDDSFSEEIDYDQK